MKQNQQCLDAINILKGITYSHLLLQDLRIELCQSNSIDLKQIFSMIDTKSSGKAQPHDIISFMAVHRFALSQRQAQYLIYISGSQTQFMDFESFQCYFTCGDPQLINSMLMKSRSFNHGIEYAEQMMKNIGQMEISAIYAKEVQFYRTIEKLKDDFIKKHGFAFKNVISAIDRIKKGHIDFENLAQFVLRFGVEFSLQQFSSLGARAFSKDPALLTYKQLMKLFSPFEPVSFPTYRKQNNFQAALQYINKEVAKLNINTKPIPFYQSGTDRPKTTTGFNKVIENYRNQGQKPESLNTKYFYDQNYYNELKQYKTNFFEPNKDVKKKVQNQMIGPQYHDHFFSDYYLYLEQRNKLQHFYNKFGKRYTFQNPIAKGFAKNI